MYSQTVRSVVAFMLALAAPLAESSLFAQAMETNDFLNINMGVPDGNVAGLSDVRTVSSSIGELASVRVKLRLQGEFNGDLYGYLRHVTPDATNFCVLLNRPGRAASDPFGYDDSGLDITFDDTALNDFHNYRAMISPPAGMPITGVWQPDGRRVSPMAVSAVTSRTGRLSSFSGGPASGEWTLFLADVEAGGTNLLASWSLEFSAKSNPVITWATPTDIVYGTPLGATQLNASASVPGIFAYNPPPSSVLNAGPAQRLTAIFTPSNLVTHWPATTNVAINVLKKPLIISAQNATNVYGAPLPLLTARYSGFVNGDTPASLDVPALIPSSATADSPIGSYPILVSSAADSNYEMTFVSGSLNVIPARTIATLTLSTNPPLSGGPSVTFTFVTRAVAPSTAVPSGEVTFKVNTIAQRVPLTAGTATFAIPIATLGTHVLIAEYTGNANLIGVTNRFDEHVNSPPVAVADNIQRNVPGGARVLIATLLANDSDADGDPITFLSVSPLSYNRGSVTQDDNWVYYTAPAGSTNDDIFSYAISDGRGLPVTGVAYVKAIDSSAPNLAITHLNNAFIRIRLTGTPNLFYRIEYADSLNPPNWQTLTGRAADDLGEIELTDAPPLGSAMRFYRATY